MRDNGTVVPAQSSTGRRRRIHISVARRTYRNAPLLAPAGNGRPKNSCQCSTELVLQSCHAVSEHRLRNVAIDESAAWLSPESSGGDKLPRGWVGRRNWATSSRPV